MTFLNTPDIAAIAERNAPQASNSTAGGIEVPAEPLAAELSDLEQCHNSVVPYRRIDNPRDLKALLGAALAVESGLDLESILKKCVEEAASLVGARYGALGVLNESGDSLSQFFTTGMSPNEISDIGDLPAGLGVLGVLIRNPKPIRIDDISKHPASVGFPAKHPTMTSFLGVPISIRGEVYGNLYLTEKIDGDGFTQEDENLVLSLASAAGIAIENAQLHERVQELALADDRERIARDLHDIVIQRIFATGISLQAIIRLIDNDEAAFRIQEAIDNLDETIRQVRTAIFSLEATRFSSSDGLRSRVLDLIDESSRGLGFQPQVRFAGAIDSEVNDKVAGELLASLREILANVARHAMANSVNIEISIEKNDIVLEINDDGIGIKDTTKSRGKGIENFCGRATELGGSCVLHNRSEGGTAVIWRAPI